MSDLVRFTLADGSEVLFETAEGDLVSRHSGEPSVEEGGPLAAKLSQAAATADAVARTLRSRLSPDELSVELGFKISGEVNWFFAKNAAEGNIKVTLKWAGTAAPGLGPRGAVGDNTEADDE